MDDYRTRAIRSGDEVAVAAIYNYYIEHTVITFETSPISASDMGARILDITGRGYPFLVCEGDGGVAGYAYLNRWNSRCAYVSSVESTIYLDSSLTGRGIGRRLYTTLVDAARDAGSHALIAGIALPNAASVALHERLGFQKVAHFREVGFKHDRWIDVGYWELLLSDSPRPL